MKDDNIIAFAPMSDDIPLGDYKWIVYNKSMDNPYNVDNPKEKIREAQKQIDPDQYSLHDDEKWIRFEYESVVNGEMNRIETDDR